MLVLLAFAAVPSCAPSATQLVVVVDTDLAIPSALDEVRVQVTGPEGMSETEMTRLASRSALPLSLGVAPSGAVLGPIDVIATGYVDGDFVVDRSATVTLVAGETRVLSLFLLSNCVGVTCPAGETCGEGGSCERRTVVPPEWTGVLPSIDGGSTGVDAPGADVPGLDAPDGGMPDGGPPCLDDAECDDGVDCTTDVCGLTGCQHVPDDSVCDDGNPCTDGTCGDAGCEQANNTAPCPDGSFCNGEDVCAGGVCTHPGDPCTAPTTCNESTDRCDNCTTRAQCPTDTMGTWTSCDYADGCDEGAVRSRTDITWDCVASACVPTPMVVNEACTRDTDGSSCGAGSCGGYGGCTFPDACTESGTMSRMCTDLVCVAGACSGRPRSESAGCSRDTDGVTCNMTSCGAYGACDYTGACDDAANQTRTCTDYRCAAGSCAGSMRTESMACTRSTNGTSCGAAVCGAWSACTYGSTCATSGTQTRTCMDPVCTGGTCTMSGMRTEMQSCGTRSTNGMDCGTTCGPYGACSWASDCDEDATQARTCTPRTCSAGSCVTGSDTTEYLGCTRSTNGLGCDIDTCSPGYGMCSSGSCTGSSACSGACICDNHRPFGSCYDPTPPYQICAIE